jgi:GNAT superfamily N-acetyltransferase
MQLKRLLNVDHEFFNQAFELYQSAFPLLERRDKEEQERIFAKPDYHYDIILQNDQFIGIMLYWETENFIFLEHFSTLEHLRGKGYGSSALSLLKQKGKPVLLEIEPPISRLTQRRYQFYCRNGFILNPHFHIQAKFRVNDDDLQLKILSYPNVLSQEDYQSFYTYMLKEISAQP